jgi:hypothetical protein
MLAAVVSNMSGKTLKRSVDMSVFLPKYLREPEKPMNTDKSLEQQRAEFSAFRAKYQAAEAKAQGNKP